MDCIVQQEKQETDCVEKGKYKKIKLGIGFKIRMNYAPAFLFSVLSVVEKEGEKNGKNLIAIKKVQNYCILLHNTATLMID